MVAKPGSGPQSSPASSAPHLGFQPPIIAPFTPPAGDGSPGTWRTRFTNMEAYVGGLVGIMNELWGRMSTWTTSTDSRLATIEGKLNANRGKVDEMEAATQNLKTPVGGMEMKSRADLEILANKARESLMTLANSQCPNSQIPNSQFPNSQMCVKMCAKMCVECVCVCVCVLKCVLNCVLECVLKCVLTCV